MRRTMTVVPLLAGLIWIAGDSSANLVTFTKEEGRADRVMVMDDAGAGVTELYALPKATPVRPFSSISPPESPGGGAWIAFFNGDGDLYKVRDDGTDPTRLLCDPVTDVDGNFYSGAWSPQWSPDGTEILVVVLDPDTGFNYPAILDANLPASGDCSSDLKPIYYELPPGVSPELWELFRYATWNDDGSKIAFFEVEWDSFDNIIGVQLVVLTKNGTSWVTVRKDLNVNELPLRNPPEALDWQRGGDLLAFSLREGPRSAPVWLYWVDVTSGASGPMTVGGVPAEGEGPTWSPDGSQLMYFTGWQRKIAVRDHLGNGELGEVATILGPGIWPDWQRDPLSACSSDADCGDGELCDNGVCFVPECGAVGLPDCDDFNDCTVDTCNNYRCTFDPAAAAGLFCDDGNFCTEGDDCDGSGVCEGALNPTIPGCEPVGGLPGDPCTSGADCLSGLCHPKKKVCK